MPTRRERQRREPVILRGPSACAVILFVFAAGCASGLSLKHRNRVDKEVRRGRFEQAVAYLEKHRKDYGERDQVLYDLTVGTLCHYAAAEAERERREELIRRSEAAFERAERRIEDLYTKHLSRDFASLLTSDNVYPFEGEEFEKVQINIVRALSSALLGEMDEALVEARKVDLKLRLMNESYGRERGYTDDGFAHLLSGLLYETAGEVDQAVVAYRASARAYARQHGLTGVRPPSWLGGAGVRLCRRLGSEYTSCAPEVAKWFPEPRELKQGRKKAALRRQAQPLPAPKAGAEKKEPELLKTAAGAKEPAADKKDEEVTVVAGSRADEPKVAAGEEAAVSKELTPPAAVAPAPKPPPRLNPKRRSRGTGTLVVVQAVGQGPVKVQRTFSITVGKGLVFVRDQTVADDEGQEVHRAMSAAQSLVGQTVVVAWPKLVRRENEAHHAVVEVYEPGTDKLVAAAPTVMVQDVATLAKRDLEDRMARIKGKMIARAVVKFVLARVAGEAAEAATKNEAVGLLTTIISGAVMAASEEADLRSWHTLPASFKLARLDLPAGRYEVAARVFGKYDRVLEHRSLGVVEVGPGRPAWRSLPTPY